MGYSDINKTVNTEKIVYYSLPAAQSFVFQAMSLLSNPTVVAVLSDISISLTQQSCFMTLRIERVIRSLSLIKGNIRVIVNPISIYISHTTNESSAIWLVVKEFRWHSYLPPCTVLWSPRQGSRLILLSHAEERTTAFDDKAEHSKNVMKWMVFCASSE